MLKVTIVHTKDTLYVAELSNDGTVISKFSEQDGNTDLMPCYQFIGQLINIEHRYEDGTVEIKEAILEDVVKNADGGTTIKYTVDNE